MSRALLFFICYCVSSAAYTQNNLLLLQKKNKTVRSFFPGKFISLETIQKTYADGLITKIINDSVFIRHFDIEKSVTEYGAIYFDTSYRYTTAIHVRDIGAILLDKPHSNHSNGGKFFIIAGAGVLALGAVNGLYRGDPPRDWYKPSAYITAGALTGLGLLLKRSANKKYLIGKKYKLKILQLSLR